MSVHTHRESENPRKAGWCDCGVRLVKWMDHALVEDPGGLSIDKKPALPRNPRFEAELVESACHGSSDPTALINHAQTRAKALCGEYVVDPMTILPGQNRIREGREELADCVNHLVFHIQEHFGEDDNEQLLRALAYVALAYHELQGD